jgi:hypothetical protein
MNDRTGQKLAGIRSKMEGMGCSRMRVMERDGGERASAHAVARRFVAKRLVTWAG